MEILVAIAATWLLSAPGEAGLEVLARLDHGRIPEASGVVASLRHPGVFWVHNDSGNPPLLFAVRADGRIVGQFRVGAANVDWEDLVLDDQGRLYLGDIGNNGGRLPLRAIYRLDEPDPSRAADRPLAVTLATFYTPTSATGRFDSEAMILNGHEMILIAKSHDGLEAELFAVPLDPPAPVIRPARPRPLGRLAKFTEPVTGAGASRDGALLAVCSGSVARVYSRTPERPWPLLGEVRYNAPAVEGIAWDGLDLVLVAEGGPMYRIREKTWRGPSGSSRTLPHPRGAAKSSPGRSDR